VAVGHPAERGFMMTEWTGTAPCSDGGVASGSGVAVGSFGKSLRAFALGVIGSVVDEAEVHDAGVK
jgi:hypothetical protein